MSHTLTTGDCWQPTPTPIIPFCTPRRGGPALSTSATTEKPPSTPFSRVEMEYIQEGVY